MPYSSSESGGASRPVSDANSSQQKPRSRTQSLSSEWPSTIGQGLMTPPLSISPEAVFIAASAASQIVTTDHDNHANTWYDQHGIESSGEPAIVSNPALQLVNNFLDQLLLRFLSIARSTSLAALRPAVIEVLKPKLAKDAINQADEELREYLGGGDDEDMLQSQTPDSPKNWDLELVWKRTRLRCMVYSSLGDMEEEDEDFYTEQEHLEGGDDTLGETVSPAVAIFLTSILEFMGEQALISAGQAAYHRMRFIYEKEHKVGGATSDPAPVASRITVDEVDMDRVAFDRTIGRLWRAWKKRIRSPVTDLHAFQHRSFSQELGRQGAHMRQVSQDDSTITGTISETGECRDITAQHEHSRDTENSAEQRNSNEEPKECAVDEKDEEDWLKVAVSVPIPVGVGDILEILLPGLVDYSDDDDVFDANKRDAFGRNQINSSYEQTRPKSLTYPPSTTAFFSMMLSDIRTPRTLSSRARARSLPTPFITTYVLPADNHIKASGDKTELDDDSSNTRGDDSTPMTILGPEASDTAADGIECEPTAPTTLGEDSEQSLPVPLQMSVIGAAITTSSAEAVPASSIIAGGTTGRDVGARVLDEFAEEAEILVSSRVSVSGRSNSPANSELGCPVPPSPGLPFGSPNVHSLRVIDVPAPRSPVTRSHNVFVNAAQQRSDMSRTNDSSRTSAASWTSSISARAIDEGGASQTTETLKTPVVSARKPSPIDVEVSRSPRESNAKTEQNLAKEDDTLSQIDSPQAAVTQTPELPQPPTAAPSTKVTIISSTKTPESFYLDDETEESVETFPTEAGPPERRPKSQGAASISPPSPLREQPPPSPRIVNFSSPSRSRDQQPRTQIQAQTQVQARTDAQLRAEVEAAGRKQSVASSISSSTSKLKTKSVSEENTVMRPEDVARNFEELIQSDQTIQYTLTPENMRNFDSSRSTHEGSSFVMKSRKSEDTRQLGDQSRSSSNSLDTRPTEPLVPPPRSPRSADPSVNSMTSRARGAGPQARDARVPRESLADFADFIRATGPSDGFVVPTTSSPQIGTTSGSASNNLLKGPALVTKASGDLKRASTIGSRQRYQAREAVVNKDDNSDLIDFIRRGPPSAAGSNHPRIPRHVAPFRTTMDSDQMSGAVGGRAVDAKIPSLRHSAASISVTESSMGSSAGLIKQDQNPTLANTSVGKSTSNMFDDADVMPIPKRKTRRVRDPYAIDLTDEEDEFDMPQPANGRRPASAVKEESLIDFLNSVPPPVDTNPVPFDIPQTRNQQQPAVPKKKASAPSLISRFTRNNTSNANGTSRGLLSSGESTSGYLGGLDSRSLISRAGSTMTSRSRNHIPIQVNIPPGLESHAANSAMAASTGVRPAGSSTSSGRVPMKRLEPREPQAVSSRATQDLADFFRNSGPPQSFRG
ncbi:hypothetical protein SEPCBS119000_002107 [Sporothrix epigloea]|uniref:Uncharacterized protein n=1 Tax=Sporothrix epigloea TaxID=1892477 RepID=A0ABP0DED1_9PEZI